MGLEPSSECVWVTGASSGIGYALCRRLIDKGWTVAGTARDVQRLESTRQKLGDAFHSFPADITSRQNLFDVVDNIERKVGPISLAILNAGIYHSIKNAEFDDRVAKEIFSVNIIGTSNCLSAVSSHMRERRRGHIAIMSSLAGYRGLPNSAAYCASRAAVLVLGESLNCDFKKLGIKMQVITPGFVKTPMTGKNAFPMPFLMSPEDAADAILKGLNSKRFEITFPLKFSYMLKILRILPYPLYFRLVQNFVRIRGD